MTTLSNLFQTVLVAPFCASPAHGEPPVDSARDQVKIAGIKAMQSGRRTLIKVETDDGLVGYGPCGESGLFARAVLAKLEGGRLPHLGFVGKDPRWRFGYIFTICSMRTLSGEGRSAS